MSDRNKKSKKMRTKLVQIFFVVRHVLDWIVDSIFRYFYRNRPKCPLPPVAVPYLTDSAVNLAHKIRSRKLSSECVVRAYIERIEEVNGTLNAVVDDRYEAAIEEAKMVDLRLAETALTAKEIEDQKPFLGVPFTNKESTSAEGMSFTFGLISRRGVIAGEDADIVSRIREGGGILIGVTNVPELNLWCETRNNLYGQTCNPYDVQRTVGGSSGGEGAIISACGSPIGIGTDIGGSGRMPAFYCGIFGHKPTAGLINTRGMTFRSGDELDTMVAAGPMCRHAEDIAPFLKLLVGKKNCQLLKLDKPVDVKALKYYYIEEPGDYRVSPVSGEMKKVVAKAAKHLAGLSGSGAEMLKIPGFKYSLALWRHGMTKEPGDFALDLGNRENKVSWFGEILNLVFGRCKFTLPAVLRLLDVGVLPPTNPKWAENETNHIRNELKKILGSDGVLLFPSCPSTAPYHYAPFFRPYNFAYWAIFNALKFPATQVPMGLSETGLPLGLQVVAGPYNDHLTIAVAAELESAFGGWVPPFANADTENK